MTIPLVSICSITYNHAPFIRQCLDGFLMQQCNFPIEIIINDDCSTDGTTEIIREYAEKYPDKIFPIFHEENQYSKGVRGMFQKFVFPKARGKYIALCEGDDYWTAPLKLQKQVDFLESHPDYSMTYSNFINVDGDNNRINDIASMVSRVRSVSGYVLSDLICGNFVHTPTVCLRRSVLLSDIYANNCEGDIDWGVFLECASKGKVYFMDECLACYRIHGASMMRTCGDEVTRRGISSIKNLVRRVCLDKYGERMLRLSDYIYILYAAIASCDRTIVKMLLTKRAWCFILIPCLLIIFVRKRIMMRKLKKIVIENI